MNNARLTVRPFESYDEPAVVGVWFRSGKAAYEYLPDWRQLTLERACEVFREVILPPCDLWVGERNGQVAAFLAIRGSYIDRMYVDPAEQRQGWGARLIQLARMLSPRGLELHTHRQNTTARRFYEKNGFTAVGFGLSPPPESAPDVEYHWRPGRSGGFPATDRLDLLPITREHAPEMFGVLDDAGLYTFVGSSRPSDVESLARQYAYWESRRSPDDKELWFNWAVRLRTAGVLVGHVQAGVRSDCADIAWVVGSKWQRCGYATEAARAVMEWLANFGVREIHASIHPDNVASIRVAERLGFAGTSEFQDGERIWKAL